MTIDPSTSIGKVRLRVADYSDIPFFPDSVYESVIEECNGNVAKASQKMAQYILGTLAFKTHRKLAQLEVWGSEAFKQYKEFLVLTVKDPAFMEVYPMPYSPGTDSTHPLIEFVEKWNKEYSNDCNALDDF